MDNVQLAIDGPVAIVRINRPEVRNAVDPDTAAALRVAFARVAEDDTILAAVLTGRGGTFCAGYDLTAFAVTGLDPVALDGLGPGQPGPMGPTRSLPAKPTIAAIEGHAVAGGAGRPSKDSTRISRSVPNALRKQPCRSIERAR